MDVKMFRASVFTRTESPVCSTVGLLDEAAVGVDAGAVVLLLCLLLAEPQDVLQAVQSHLDDLGVHHRQQVAQRLDAAQVHQVSARTTARRSRNSAAAAGDARDISVTLAKQKQHLKKNASPGCSFFYDLQTRSYPFYFSDHTL